MIIIEVKLISLGFIGSLMQIMIITLISNLTRCLTKLTLLLNLSMRDKIKTGTTVPVMLVYRTIGTGGINPNLKSESQKKSIYSVAKKSKSKQKQKQIRLFDKPSQVIINRLGTPTNKGRSHNYTFSHSSNLKGQDKTRLQDLGAKLQNLRNQIRK